MTSSKVADGAADLKAAVQGIVNLVVTNDCMPRMSGDELTVRLQQLCPALPILHISGEPYDAAEDTGGHYLYKPFGPSESQRVVRTLLAGRTQQQP